MFSFVVDKFETHASAVLHISDLAVQRGYGIFDFFKIKGRHIFFLADHLDRFFHSAKIMKLAVPYSREQIKGFIFELIEKNALTESGIKMILTGGYSTDGYNPARSNLLMTQHPLTLPSADQIDNGVRIITHPYVKEFPEAKTINYSMGIWLLDNLKAAGAADVLYYEGEIVSEFPRCNVFIVTHDNVILTPARKVLHGVTRKNILKLTGAQYTIKEADITRDEVYQAREVFLTSTTKRILPVVRVDDRIISEGQPGPVTLGLLNELLRLEERDAV